MDVDAFTNECQAFIFNWHRVTENAKVLQKQFTDAGIETRVINSDEAEENNGLGNWVHIGESGYMVQQYAKAIECFRKTYFIELFADIYDVDIDLILRRACYTFNKYNCGIYAPNVDYIYWNFDRTKIPRLEENLYEVKNAESLLSFIHRDVIQGVRLNADKYTVGWGIDFLVAVLADLQNKKVIRDDCTTIRHPKGRGYRNTNANKEYEQFINEQRRKVAKRMRQWRDEAHALVIKPPGSTTPSAPRPKKQSLSPAMRVRKKLYRLKKQMLRTWVRHSQ